MKHKRIFLAAALSIALLGTAAWLCLSGRRPFRELQASDLQFVTVRLSPPDQTLVVPDLEELTAYLRDLVIYQEDDSYTDYAGQAAVFTLTMADGTRTEVTAYASFLIIDGVGYRTRHEPCEALNRYANELARSGECAVALEKPPALAVVSDETSQRALLGAFTWQRRTPDGTTTQQLADAAHPLDCRELLEPLDTTAATAALQFTQAPNEVHSVRCWSDTYWGQTGQSGKELKFHGNEIPLQPGGYIYEVTAVWGAEDGWGGTVSYAFYIRSRP